MLRNHKFNPFSVKIIISFNGNGYLEFDIRIRKANGDPFNIGLAPAGDKISLVNNAFAYANHDARISTSTGV